MAQKLTKELQGKPVLWDLSASCSVPLTVPWVEVKQLASGYKGLLKQLELKMIQPTGKLLEQ